MRHMENRWFHGSNQKFEVLRAGSTITPRRELAEAFSHKPAMLSIADDGTILHNGTEYGYLYEIEEPLSLDQDIYEHPRTTIGKNMEFLTRRPLRVKLLWDTGYPGEGELINLETPLQPEGSS